MIWIEYFNIVICSYVKFCHVPVHDKGMRPKRRRKWILFKEKLSGDSHLVPPSIISIFPCVWKLKREIYQTVSHCWREEEVLLLLRIMCPEGCRCPRDNLLEIMLDLRENIIVLERERERGVEGGGRERGRGRGTTDTDKYRSCEDILEVFFSSKFLSCLGVFSSNL